MNPDDKTPRDWLLSRHTAAISQLDALRHAALPGPAMTWRDFFGELFSPHRNAWRALAATWVALALFHLTHPVAQPDPRVARPSPDVVALWLTQLKSHETFAQIDRHP